MESQMIDVEEIIRELRKEVALRDMPEIGDFDDVAGIDFEFSGQGEAFDPDFLLREMEMANRSFTINPNVMIGGRCKLLKRIIRKLSFFIVKPLAEAATEYNIHIIRSMNQIRNYIVARNSVDKDVALMKGLAEEDMLWKEKHGSRIRELLQENMRMKKCLEELFKERDKGSLVMERMDAELKTLREKVQLLSDRCAFLSDASQK